MSEFSRELLSFVEISRERSIRRAAERLNIAPSALSRQMRLLEGDLGVQLLVRNVKGIQLTEQGNIVLKQAEQWFEDGNQLRAKLANLEKSDEGRVRIGAMECFSRTLVPRLFEAMTEQGSFNQMDVKISDTETLVECLRQRTVDLVVAFNVQHSQSVRVMRTVPCRIGLIYSPKKHTIVEDEISIAGCLDWPIILPGNDLSLHPRLFAEILKQRKKPNIVSKSNSVEFIREVVARGNGVSFLTWFDVRDEVLAGRLGFIPLIEKRLVENLCICISGDGHLRPELSALIRTTENLIYDLSEKKT